MKILVIGCGAVGRRHAAHATEHAETAVLDRDGARAQACAEALGVRRFRDLETALAWHPDGVVVATPHASHLALAEAAVEAGAAVLVEKPLALDDARAARFAARVEAAGGRAFVVCNLRFHPGPTTLARHLDEIGSPWFARAHYGNYLPDQRPGADWRQLYCAQEGEGGVILDAVHDLDILVRLLGPVDAVAGAAAPLGDLGLAVETYAALTLAHAGGAWAELHLDYLRRGRRRGCEVTGSAGTLLWESEGRRPERCTVRRWLDGAWATLVDTEVDNDVLLAEVMQRFAAAIAGDDHEGLQSASEGAHVLAVALAARRAAREGTRVVLS